MEGRLIPPQKRSPAMNMAIDEALFIRKTVERNHALTCRFYSWNRSVFSFGYFSKIPENLLASVRMNCGARFIRRITGGGWVYHGMDLPFTLVLDTEKTEMTTSIQQSYQIIHTAVLKALEKAGTPPALMVSGTGSSGPSCFTSPVSGDLLVSGKKVLGGAQRRRKGVLLYQGSLLFGQPDRHAACIDETDSFLRSIITSNSSLESLAGRKFSQSSIIENITEALTETFSIDFDEIPVSGIEQDEAQILAREKYETPAWTIDRKC